MAINYLEEAAAAARAARDRYMQKVADGETAAAGLIRVAEVFARLAAIEKGLLPQEMATGTADAGGGG